MVADSIDIAADVTEQTALDRRVAQAEERFGGGRVQALTMDLRKIDTEGAFINVDTHGFRALRRQLTPEALGIIMPNDSPLSVSMPQISVIPDRHRKYIMRAPDQAHDALRRWSVSFSAVRAMMGSQQRWVAAEAFDRFEEDFAAAQAVLEEGKKRILDNYDGIVEEVIDAFRRIARDSIRRLEATGGTAAPDQQERLVHTLESFIPSRQFIEHGLTISFSVGVVRLGSDILEEQRRMVEHQEAQEREREMTAAQRRIEQLRIEHVQEMMEEELSPMREGLMQLNAQLYEAAKTIKASIDKNGRLHGSSAKKARDTTERLLTLQQVFADGTPDSEKVAELLRDLQRLASSDIGKTGRDVAPVETVLNEMLQATVGDWREYGRVNRMGALEF